MTDRNQKQTSPTPTSPIIPSPRSVARPAPVITTTTPPTSNNKRDILVKNRGSSSGGGSNRELLNAAISNDIPPPILTTIPPPPPPNNNTNNINHLTLQTSSSRRFLINNNNNNTDDDNTPISPFYVNGARRNNNANSVYDDEPNTARSESTVFQLEQGGVTIPVQRYTGISARQTDLQNRLRTLKGDTPIPPAILEVVNDDVSLDTLRQQREQRWALKPPTSNEHLLHVMKLVQNPWENRVTALMDVNQICNLIESLYYSPKTLANSQLYMPRKKQDCVMVCGVARVGQTPVLKILDMLRNGTSELSDTVSFLKNVIWLEGLDVSQNESIVVDSSLGGDDNTSSIPSFTGSSLNLLQQQQQPGKERILIKTHCPVHSFVERNRAPPVGRSASKLVCVLRHPYYVRQSWYHHARKVYKGFLPLEEWRFEIDEFVRRPLGTPQSVALSTGYVNLDYEDYIADVLNAYEKHPGMVHVVFFEDLIINMEQVVHDLAEFTGWNYRVVDGNGDSDINHQLFGQIALEMKVPLRPFPKYLKYSKLYLQDQWDSRIRRIFPTIDKYESLYKYITGKEYPFVTVVNKNNGTTITTTPAALVASNGNASSTLGRLSRKLSIGSRKSSRDVKKLPAEEIYESMDHHVDSGLSSSPIRITNNQKNNASMRSINTNNNTTATTADLDSNNGDEDESVSSSRKSRWGIDAIRRVLGTSTSNMNGNNNKEKRKTSKDNVLDNNNNTTTTTDHIRAGESMTLEEEEQMLAEKRRNRRTLKMEKVNQFAVKEKDQINNVTASNNPMFGSGI
jgi:hypothetical protein